MRIRFIFPVLLLLTILLFSCVEKYWPELDNNYQNILVVEGMITNGPGPYTIKLSLATTVENPQFIPQSGYTVSITDDIGNSEVLYPSGPGLFLTSPTGIQGIIGRKYKIRIISQTGNTYESAVEELKEPVGIDSVYATFEIHENNSAQYPAEGYQFYINTKTAASDSTFFLWKLEKCFKYKSDFKIKYMYSGTLEQFPHPDSLQYCWKTENIRDIFTFNTLGLSTPVVRNFPLNYATTDTREISIKYSLLVKQFTISEKAYTFWNTVKEQNSAQDILYTRQPYQVQGNVFNTENPDETVLGYFMVGGVSEKRVFVDRPLPPVHFRYPVCEAGENEAAKVADIYRSNADEWPIFLTTSPEWGIVLPNQDCLDCRLKGGTIEKPDFWIGY